MSPKPWSFWLQTSSSPVPLEMCFHPHLNYASLSKTQEELLAFLQQATFAFKDRAHASLEILLLLCAHDMHEGKMLFPGLLMQLFLLEKLFLSGQCSSSAPEGPSPAATLAPAEWCLRENLAPISNFKKYKVATYWAKVSNPNWRSPEQYTWVTSPSLMEMQFCSSILPFQPWYCSI